MNGYVEHPADVGAVNGTIMHAEADKTTRELVHDHEHPVAPEHDGLASKQLHAPQAVARVSDLVVRLLMFASPLPLPQVVGLP